MCDTNATSQELCGNIGKEIQVLRRRITDILPECQAQEWDRMLSLMREKLYTLGNALGDAPEDRASDPEEDGDDGQPDEYQEWHDYDPDC